MVEKLKWGYLISPINMIDFEVGDYGKFKLKNYKFGNVINDKIIRRKILYQKGKMIYKMIDDKFIMTVINYDTGQIDNFYSTDLNELLTYK